MKTITLLFFLFVLTISVIYGQQFQRDYDFSKVDPTTIDVEKLQAYKDSIYALYKFDSIYALISYRHEKTYSPKYVSFNVGVFGQMASLKYLNRGLKESQMEEMNEAFATIPIGFSVKGKRWISDYFIHATIRNKVDNDDWRLDVSGGRIGFMVGYDVANTKRFQLYPQAGLSFQTMNLKSRNKHADDYIGHISQLAYIAGNTSMTKASLSFDYGIEADYFVSFSEGSGIILGLVYGMSYDVIPGKFKIDKERSSLNIHDDRLRSSYFGIVLKLTEKHF